MLNRQIVEFDAESVLKLLTHYTDGKVPLDSVLKSVGVSSVLDQWLGLDVESNEWEGELFNGQLANMHIRYENKQLMVWSDKRAPIEWSKVGAVKAPKAQ